MSDVLAKIIQHKQTEVAERKRQTPLDSFKPLLEKSTRSLKAALSAEQASFILECKKASPSRGLIREKFDLSEILEQYKDYASAISVLTDKRYFQGDFSYLKQASESVEQPILCKDFFIDAYQVYEARHHGADAILLMLSVLDDDNYRALAQVARQLDLDVLTEVHDQIELERALTLDAKIIGINNRNLKDLSIDLATTEKLASQIPADRIVLSESGINNHQQVKQLAPLVDGFLIGSSIMASPDIRSQCKALLYGRVKICGLTRIEDAREIDKMGALYAGFIFYPKSKRYISPQEAKPICNAVKLKYVGVFVDESIDTLVKISKDLNLYAVQLHGDETPEFIRQLKIALPEVKIWKAIRVKDSLKINKNPQVDSYLLDAYSAEEHGGSGKSFDWQLLNHIDASELILAGGINAENINQALEKNCYAIDLSSGVEQVPGIKDPQKLAHIFAKIRV